MVIRLSPLLEEPVELLELDEQMRRRTDFRFRVREFADRIKLNFIYTEDRLSKYTISVIDIPAFNTSCYDLDYLVYVLF